MGTAIFYKGTRYPTGGSGGGGGGSSVIPNPSGTPTDTLDTIEIDGDIYEIQGGGGGGTNLILNAAKYSTDEQVVGIWIDGKPLYQKTVTGTTSSSSGSTAIFNLATNNAEKIISCEGYVGWTNQYGDTAFRNITGYGDSNAYGIWGLNASKTDVLLVVGNYMRDNDYIATLRYTKTTDTAGSGGYQAYGFSPIIYSTVEREIGVWTDDKPLYCKTIQATLTSTTHQIDVSGLDIDTFVDAKGFLRYQSGNDDQTTDYPYYSGSDYWSGGYFNKGQKIYYVQSSNDSVRYYNIANITFYYTKTTDTSGSGSYNTLAIPNIHYTTDEQVIGTWTDGKPLYQKTCATPLTLNTESGEKTYTLDISNVDKVISVDYSIGSKAFVINVTRTSASDEIRARISQGNQLIVWSGYDRTTFTIYTTMKYTKTTD